MRQQVSGIGADGFHLREQHPKRVVDVRGAHLSGAVLCCAALCLCRAVPCRAVPCSTRSLQRSLQVSSVKYEMHKSEDEKGGGKGGGGRREEGGGDGGGVPYFWAVSTLARSSRMHIVTFEMVCLLKKFSLQNNQHEMLILKKNKN